ncbi:NAD(P)/FAD-dependent oxidoreductase [Streptomyces sp. AV19]|uniref:flavin-containing monooxygenase n=1 Tax=Streptomyces sp. AV19 TaxID=2793068 RepID=UPI0018FEF054|nr:NAD(P)/FAD-dependent oxidoreductase [Streptomyces sp. AV19]MBH1934487.1 NAD(P)/FAD-dependent oxidoreductase [Streptomyces sp. AV19]MDG4533279.1 NAD(P)/FAD-dependent oxidoreductase [Streptomyces sp. AV19]
MGGYGTTDVVVIGAGLSGTAAVIALRRAGFEDVVVLEKSARGGGTWRDNTYPGCGCDVPAVLYEYSFAPHPWSRCFASRSEILDYLRTTASEHGVDRVVQYGVEVQEARWDAAAHHWTLRTTGGTRTARAVVLATGLWNRPRYPDIPGLDAFPGPVFHSARWDHDVDLTGRHVAVVGTGASAVQFVPEIQPGAGRVEIFQSTPQWVLPKPDYALPQFLHRHPALHRALRGQHYWTQEAIGFLLRHPRLLPSVEALGRLHLRASVRDPALRRALTPRHRFGVRRIIASDTYYPALTRPNVRLHPTRATAVQGRDVIGADGTRARADVVVLATGFHIGEAPFALHGTDGTALSRTWEHDRRAYLGTGVSGYPNLFLLPGPNLFSGTTAVPTAVEAQLHHIVSALVHLRAGGYTALDVRPEVQEAHGAALRAGLRSTVYNTADGTGYYFGVPGVNTFCWPWSTGRLVERLRSFEPDAYSWSTPPRRTGAVALPSSSAGETRRAIHGSE